MDTVENIRILVANLLQVGYEAGKNNYSEDEMIEMGRDLVREYLGVDIVDK